MIDTDTIRRRLAGYEPPDVERPRSAKLRASVAIVIAGPPDGLSICFIQRSERPGDRWSGQMAFPGGHADYDDESERDAARRETREEVGVRLTASDFIGTIDPVRLGPTGAPTGAVLYPVVYALDRITPLHPDPHEVQAAAWIRIDRLFDPARATTIDWTLPGGEVRTFPGIVHGREVIWGLTFRVLGRFGQIVGLPGLPPAW